MVAAAADFMLPCFAMLFRLALTPYAIDVICGFRDAAGAATKALLVVVFVFFTPRC